jgi:hypothetical protein
MFWKYIPTVKFKLSSCIPFMVKQKLTLSIDKEIVTQACRATAFGEKYLRICLSNYCNHD